MDIADCIPIFRNLKEREEMKRATLSSSSRLRQCLIFCFLFIMIGCIQATTATSSSIRQSKSPFVSSVASLPRKYSNNNNYKVLLVLQEETDDILLSHHTVVDTLMCQQHHSLFGLRGGGGSDDDEEDITDDDEYDDDEYDKEDEEAYEGEEESDNEGEDSDDEDVSLSVSSDDIVGTFTSITRKVVVLVGKFTIQTAKAIKRGIQAGLEGGNEDDDENDAPTPIPIKVIRTLKRMIKAAFTFPSSEEDIDIVDVEKASVKETTRKKGKSAKSSSSSKESSKVETETIATPPAAASSEFQPDFGTFLAKTYGISDERGGDGESGGPALSMIGGNFPNALKVARSQARMLVVFIPAARPSKKKGKKSKDEIAIESVLSSEVAKSANKRAIRKKKGGGSGGEGSGTGSFLLWGAKAGSSEASTAIKRLKVQTTSTSGDKRPILAVVYPGKAIDGSGIKIVPKLLAQHHCSPPPTSALMAAWLDSLRKRYSKQFRVMQTEIKEIEFYKERKQGYKDSMKNDAEREELEKVEAAKKVAEEKAEKERLAAIESRRKELKESLPSEPKGGDAKRVAVRFADGRSGQRRFSPDEKISTIFNWVDAMFEMEREKVILTTMNGKDTFTWDEETNDKSLSDLGLGKMVGFRVSETKETTDEDSEEPSETDE